MSKSHKKQQARKRAAEAASSEPGPAMPAAETANGTPAPAPGEPALGLPTPEPGPIDAALFDAVMAAAVNAGRMREEGDRLAYVFNGDDIAVKYVEPSDDGREAATMLVAAFRLGVVYQVRDGFQVVYRPGPWEQALARLATEAPPEDSDEPEAAFASDGEDDGEDEDEEASVD